MTFPFMTGLKNNLFKNLSKKRYTTFKWIYEDWMILKTMTKSINIRHKITSFGFNPDIFIRDFNKIVGTLINKPGFDLID